MRCSASPLNSESVLTSLGVDTRYLYPNGPSNWSYSENPDGTWKDEFGTTYRRVGFYADNVDPVLKGKSFAEVKAYTFPDPSDPSRFKGLREKALALHSSTDYALVSGSMLCFDYMRWVLRGLEDAIADLHECPRLAEYQLDAIVDWMIAFGGGIMDAIGDLIEIFWVGDDWGAQGGPFYSPEMFRKIMKPRIARLIGAMKKKTRAKCAYHCCGSVRWAIPDLMEAGVDILHPLQPSAQGNGDTRRHQVRVRKKALFPRGHEQPGPLPRRCERPGTGHAETAARARTRGRVHLLLRSQHPGEHDRGEHPTAVLHRPGLRAVPDRQGGDRRPSLQSSNGRV